MNARVVSHLIFSYLSDSDKEACSHTRIPACVKARIVKYMFNLPDSDYVELVIVGEAHASVYIYDSLADTYATIPFYFED